MPHHKMIILSSVAFITVYMQYFWVKIVNQKTKLVKPWKNEQFKFAFINEKIWEKK